MDTPHRPRSAAALAAFVLLAALACAGFAALGVWQVHRLAWKEALIAHVDAELHAAPTPAPDAAQWPALRPGADEYRRVRAQGRFDYAHETLVRATTELGAGYWVLTPMRLAGGAWLFVNRGFVPPEQRGHVPHGPDEQSVVGLLRFSQPHGSFLQANVPREGRWYSRDVAAIAHAQGLRGPVAPYFVDAQASTPGTGGPWPRPGLTVVRFPNDHLQYAITWFALAIGTLLTIGYLLVDERRTRRLAGDAAVADRAS